jgi:hypothetical protein
MLSESASLILSNASTTNPPTSTGSIKTFFTFNNIDMKNVMGEMWDKYDTFCVKVASWCNSRTTIVLSNSANAVISYNMRGLDWINVIYEATNSSLNTQWVPIINGAITGTYSVQNISNTGQSFNFKKGNRIVNLEIAININGSGPDFPNSGTGNTYNDFSCQLVFEPVIPGKMNECAFFGFSTGPAVTNINRVISADRREYYYPSFDIRNLCKNFWEKHEDFEIQMAQVLNTGISVVAGDDRITPIQLNGLNFVNNGTKQNNNTDGLQLSTENAIIGSLIVPISTAQHAGYNDYTPAPIQFKKTEDNVPLTITFKNAENTDVAAWGTLSGSNPRIAIGFFIKPIYQVEKATLCINPFGLTTTETNLGVRDTDYLTFTLKNIDMRQVCRSMWLKYNKFNIFLTSYTAASTASDGVSNSVQLQMEGFNFINQTSLLIPTDSLYPKQVATLGVIYTGTTTTPFSNSSGSCLVTTFYKTQDLVDLKLTATALSTLFGTVNPLKGIFTFTIVGVPEDEEQAKEFTQNRMKS